jgi:hypothetical protein
MVVEGVREEVVRAGRVVGVREREAKDFVSEGCRRTKEDVLGLRFEGMVGSRRRFVNALLGC